MSCRKELSETQMVWVTFGVLLILGIACFVWALVQ